MQYRVLWIDDEHENMSGFKGRALRNGIKLVSFKSLESGMSELTSNFQVYDGIILDANFFSTDSDVSGSENLSNLFIAQREIARLPKAFKIIILTGQASIYGNGVFRTAFDIVYNKGNNADIENLFNDIKSFADNQLDTQIRSEYYSELILAQRLLGTAASDYLFQILMNIRQKSSSTGDLNTLRKILEDFFRSLNKNELLPDVFVEPNVSLNPTLKFLSGKNQSKRTNTIFSEYSLNDDSIFPFVIENGLWNILMIVQSGSHRSNVDDHILIFKSWNLLNSMVFRFMDILHWYDLYLKSDPPKKNWSIKKKNESENLDLEEKVASFLCVVKTFDVNSGFEARKYGSGEVFKVPTSCHTGQAVAVGDAVMVKVKKELHADKNSLVSIVLEVKVL